MMSSSSYATQETNYLFWKRFAQGKLKTHVSSVKVRIPSPKEILSWSERRLPNSTLVGKVDNAHTVEHDTLRPVSGGLFCERIFGPMATNVCACLRKKGWNEDFCKTCEVQFTKSRLRRYQMGHILLSAPVIHIWALQGGYLATLLGKKNFGIRSIAYGKVMCQGKPKNYLFSKNSQEVSQPVLSCRAILSEGRTQEGKGVSPSCFASEGRMCVKTSVVRFPKGKVTPLVKENNSDREQPGDDASLSSLRTGKQLWDATLNPKGNGKELQSKRSNTFGDNKNMGYAPKMFSLALQEAENKWNNNPYSPFLAEKLAISYSLYGKKYYEFQKQKRLEKKFIKNSKPLVYVRGNVLPFYQFILYKPDAFKKISQFFDSSNKQKFTLPIVNYSIQKIDLPFFYKKSLDTFGKDKCKEKNSIFLWKRNPYGFTDTYFLNNKPNCSHVSILTSTAFVIAIVEGDSNINYSRDYNFKEKQLCSCLLCNSLSLSPSYFASKERTSTPGMGKGRKANRNAANEGPFSSSKFSSFLVQSNSPPKSPKSNKGMQKKEKEPLSQNNYVKHEDLHISCVYDKGNGTLNNFSTSAYIHNLRSKASVNLSKSYFCLTPQEKIFNTENFGVFNGLDNFNWATFYSGELQEKGEQPRQDSNADRQLRNQLFIKRSLVAKPVLSRPSFGQEGRKKSARTESEAKQPPTGRHGKAPFSSFKDKSFTLFRVFSNSSIFSSATFNVKATLMDKKQNKKFHRRKENVKTQLKASNLISAESSLLWKWYTLETINSKDKQVGTSSFLVPKKTGVSDPCFYTSGQSFSLCRAKDLHPWILVLPIPCSVSPYFGGTSAAIEAFQKQPPTCSFPRIPFPFGLLSSPFPGFATPVHLSCVLPVVRSRRKDRIALFPKGTLDALGKGVAILRTPVLSCPSFYFVRQEGRKKSAPTFGEVKKSNPIPCSATTFGQAASLAHPWKGGTKSVTPFLSVSLASQPLYQRDAPLGGDVPGVAFFSGENFVKHGFTGPSVLLQSLKSLNLVLLEDLVNWKWEQGKTRLNSFLLQKKLTKKKRGLRNKLAKTKIVLTRRNKLIQSFLKTKQLPEWMVLLVLPVLPPALRPILELEPNNVVVSDLNVLYQTVIRRNDALMGLLNFRALEIDILSRQVSLQQAIEKLFDKGAGTKKRPLKSLSQGFHGKKGLFRLHLLGKRVDYSGRSVIVVGPQLKLHECGLPKEMALVLFLPFLIARLKKNKIAHNTSRAKQLIIRKDKQIWKELRALIYEHPVLLNRAPTLHRLGFQAFQPILVSGKAIILPALVCTGFNADFDGDQMAVHVPLSYAARAESWKLLYAKNNMLSPATGKSVISLSQEMILGCYSSSLLINKTHSLSALTSFAHTVNVDSSRSIANSVSVMGTFLSQSSASFASSVPLLSFPKGTGSTERVHTFGVQEVSTEGGGKQAMRRSSPLPFEDEKGAANPIPFPKRKQIMEHGKEKLWFITFQEIHKALNQNKIALQTPIWLRLSLFEDNGNLEEPLEIRLNTMGHFFRLYGQSQRHFSNKIKSKDQTLGISYIRTSAGRIQLNEIFYSSIRK